MITFSEIAELITAFSAVAALIVGVRNSNKIHEVHVSINSRMDELLRQTTESAHAAGVEQERNRPPTTPIQRS